MAENRKVRERPKKKKNKDKTPISEKKIEKKRNSIGRLLDALVHCKKCQHRNDENDNDCSLCPHFVKIRSLIISG